MNIAGFVSDVQKVYRTGAATEHSYRRALENLLSSIGDDVVALNEPKRVKCGAPDFLVNRGEIVIGHVEAKDIDKDLSTLKGTEAEQKQRYLKALPNLIYTNCLDFEFYRQGELINRISIADFMLGIQPKPDQFSALENQLRDFAAQRPQTITSSEKLAEIMAGKAVLIKDVLFNALREDKDLRTELAGQYQAFQEHLIHDITREDFADIYAETVAYGMFAARLHDDTLESFSRQEALELLPKSNPFLRALFTYIAGPDLDDRIKWIIDDLADVFQAADVKKIMENFGSMTGRNDPFLHFYETFLAKYNPAKRKARGVWYTPEPVVNFIVRAVDDVLKTEFGLSMGLADTSKVTIDWDTGQTKMTKRGKLSKTGKNAVEKKEVHRVQILDPATGTGTFLAEVIKQITPKVKSVATGMWSRYIENDLIPRIHGFELLMASYAMCHMKLDMVLSELGYTPSGAPPRLGVYLTNSLEEGEPANQTLPFAKWLSNEVKQANAVKRDMPVMCVIGNPPYSSSSTNTGDWILDQLSCYKTGLGERKVNLDDDYIKFLRLSEHFIERNGSGIIGMITNNSFLDGTSHRLMRKHFLETFDDIFILNLHGDIRNESTGGAPDDNVFDITQGVSISILVKRAGGASSNHARVRYGELIGRRALKYEQLNTLQISDDIFTDLSISQPAFRFKPQKSTAAARYDAGMPLNNLFVSYSSGVQTKRDKVCVQHEKVHLEEVLKSFRGKDVDVLRHLYALPKDGRDWTIASAKADVSEEDGSIIPFLYKPFDVRYMYYSGRTKGFVAYPRREVMQHMVGHKNIALISNRQNVRDYFSFALVTPYVANHGTFYLGNRGQDYCFPLNQYLSASDEVSGSNFDQKIFRRMVKAATDEEHGKPSELDVFDYVYGVLHAPSYREQYAEFLRSDFPRIIWPAAPQEFWHLRGKGKALRELHLLEPHAIVGDAPPFAGNGDANVVEVTYNDGAVWINDSQRFEDVPNLAWNFPIGGYQPAQKWLKDRKGRKLSFEDILHYQTLIKVLIETDRIMKSIELELDD